SSDIRVDASVVRGPADISWLIQRGSTRVTHCDGAGSGIRERAAWTGVDVLLCPPLRSGALSPRPRHWDEPDGGRKLPYPWPHAVAPGPARRRRACAARVTRPSRVGGVCDRVPRLRAGHDGK